MKVVDSFPHAVREIENCWIPLPDGTRLAARIWLPVDAEQHPVPAIMEYLPYRKRDGTRWRDEPMHRYFAGHGYAALRVDLRGAGDSDGLLLDEYLPQEQQDGVDALAWIAAQPWCNGRAGMIGKSWGGFNALQIAAHRPPQLHAVITVCSTDDRYADDAHYMGGCLLNENLSWGSFFFTVAALPPDPDLVGETWRVTWQQRLEAVHPFAATWLRHPTRDDYWKQGSVCEDFSRIKCPVYAVGGWADGYSNAVPRLLAGLQVPRKGLVGPWGHLYPHNGKPGPAIGFLQEAVRWWDHWLKNRDNESVADPMYRVWMAEAPEDHPAGQAAGRWVAEPQWPSPDITFSTFFFRDQQLLDQPGAGMPPEPRMVCSPQTVGQAGGSWCSFGEQGELPGDQREEDGKSLTFDSTPRAERLEMLGAAVAELSLSVDRPQAFVCVRLCDVAPDGSSTRITYGLLNLTQRNSREHPQPLEPGRQYLVRVALNDVAHAVRPGHRIRMALSTTYWPMVWPSAEPVTLTVYPGECRLLLPVRPPRTEDRQLRTFEPPEAAPPLQAIDLQPEKFQRTLERSLATGETKFTTVLGMLPNGQPAMSLIEAIDLRVGHGIHEQFSIRDDDPLSARAEIRHTFRALRGTWSVRVETETQFSATREAFTLTARLKAFEGDQPVADRHWKETIARPG